MKSITITIMLLMLSSNSYAGRVQEFLAGTNASSIAKYIISSNDSPSSLNELEAEITSYTSDKNLDSEKLVPLANAINLAIKNQNSTDNLDKLLLKTDGKWAYFKTSTISSTLDSKQKEIDLMLVGLSSLSTYIDYELLDIFAGLTNE